MPFDVTRLREETPGCREVVHLNNAGAALVPAPVLGAQIAHLRLEARLGGYAAAEQAADQIADARAAAADLLGADADEIALLPSATHAWQGAFYAHRFAPGDRILTARAAYGSNAIAFLQVARRSGAVIEVVEDDDLGQICLADLAARLDRPRARLVALTHAPTGSGLVNPAAAVGALARAAGVPFLLDACQSAGQLPLDVQEIGCDMLSATSRKYLRGPRGAGFLYVRRGYLVGLEPPTLDNTGAAWVADGDYAMKPDARRFETYERAVAATIGMGVAIRYALTCGLPAISARVQALASSLRTQLAQIPGVRVHDRGAELSGIVTFTAAGVGPGALKAGLRAAGINTSVSDLASSRYMLGPMGLDAVVRASVHAYNTEEELAQTAREVARIAGAG